MEENPDDTRLLSSFAKLDEVKSILNKLLAVDLIDRPAEEDRSEVLGLWKLYGILNEYKEQSYLLDPHLGEVIEPIVNTLRNFARSYVSQKDKKFSSKKVERLADVLYAFIKFRGHKTTVQYFPHEVSDLPIACQLIMSGGLIDEERQWSLRYCTLLWLSLVCMLPFDLAKFDSGGENTAITLENIAKKNLVRAGVERDGAAFMLTRLYMRKDTQGLFTDFLKWAEETLRQTDSVQLCIGTLKMLSELAKLSPIDLFEPHLPTLREFATFIFGQESLMNDTIVRKLRKKLISRIATRSLPSKSRSKKRRKLVSSEGADFVGMDRDEDIDIPPAVEEAFEELFDGLQDKDSAVRWSSAKGISNISERLPPSFVDQILDTIFGFYTIHLVGERMTEMSSMAEFPWHGATLALAELARQGLIPEDRLSEFINWTTKALFFDIRKGAHSIGTNVRDSACFALWSLARTAERESMKRFSSELSQKLVLVALFDREGNIRRAASAAFQEHVGRLGLFPQGIDILAKTDFYSIGVRKAAFLTAAPQVAVHNEYREALIKHIQNVALRHWDESMRKSAAQSLKNICEIDMEVLGPRFVDEVSTLLDSKDLTEVHGGLLALAELSKAFGSTKKHFESFSKLQEKVLDLVQRVPQTMMLSPRNNIILSTTCFLVETSLTLNAVQSDNQPWRYIIDNGLKDRNEDVQIAAASAMASLSKLKDCSEDVERLIATYKRSPPTSQRSLARVLGLLEYRTSPPKTLKLALSCLVQSVDTKQPESFQDIEARRNSFTSMSQIIVNVTPDLREFVTHEQMAQVYSAFLTGLEDYTVNERGDVGSWVRLACIQGLGTIIDALMQHACLHAERLASVSTSTWSNFEHQYQYQDQNQTQDQALLPTYLPLKTYHTIIAGILKQGVERLDNVRQLAGKTFERLLNTGSDIPLSPSPQSCKSPGGEKKAWRVSGYAHFKELLVSSDDTQWNDATWLFPKAIHFLDVAKYRSSVLKGFVMSLSSKTGSTQRPASDALISYGKEFLPVFRLPSTPAPSGSPSRGENKDEDEDETKLEVGYSLMELTNDLLDMAFANPSQNSIVLPVLQTFVVLVEGDVLKRVSEEDAGVVVSGTDGMGGMSGKGVLKRLLNLSTKNVTRMKSMQRVEESMKIVVNMVSIPAIQKRAIDSLSLFLQHNYAKVRSGAAEALYLVLQTKNDITYDEEAENILLETEWSTDDASTLAEATRKVHECLHV